LSPGWDASIRRALTDGPSLLLVTCAVLAVARGRPGIGGSVLGLAALTRESSLVSGGLLLPARIRDLRWRSLFALAASVVPLGLWLLYLRSLGLHYDGGINAVSPPFVAMTAHGQEAMSDFVMAGSRPCGFANLSTLIGLFAQVLYLITHRHLDSPWWRVGAAHVLLMPILGSAVWDGCPGAITRAMLPLTVSFNLEVLHSKRAFWVWWPLGNLAILAGSELIGIPAALNLF
jgi:hypothetical protein